MVTGVVTMSASDTKPRPADQQGETGRRRTDFVLTEPQERILEACETPKGMPELLERLGLAHRTFVRRTYLQPLLDAGIVRMTNPKNPRAVNQRYVLTQAGAAIRAERLRKKGTGTP